MRFHHWILNTRSIRETMDSFAHGPYDSFFELICVHFVDKNADWDQNCSFDLVYFQRSRVFLHWFSHMYLILLLAYMRNRLIFMGKSVNELAPRALWFVTASIIKVRLKFLTFFLPFKYPWLRSHDFMYIFKSGKSVCVTACRSGYQCLIIWGPVYMEAGYPRYVR